MNDSWHAKFVLSLTYSVSRLREFLNCVRSIKILSPSEVEQMSQDQLKMLENVPVQQLQQSRPASSDSGEARPQRSFPDPSGGALDQ